MSKKTQSTDRTQWGELITDTPEYQHFKALRDDRDAIEALLTAFVTGGISEGAKRLTSLLDSYQTQALRPYLDHLDAALKVSDNLAVTKWLSHLRRFLGDDMPCFVSAAAGVCPRMPTADELVEMDPNNPRHPNNTRAKHGVAPGYGNSPAHK